jgi:hypothetical protein
MTRFSAAPLLEEEIDRAYPLVQLVLPAVSAERWRAFARTSLGASGSRGILAVRDAKGYILGLAGFRRQFELEAGAVLIAEPLLFIDLLKPEDVAMALIDAVEDQARRLQCAKVRIFISQDDAMQWVPSGTPAPNLYFMKVTPLVPATGVHAVGSEHRHGG